MESWNLKPQFGPLNAHYTISQDLLGRIGCGTICVKPNIQKISSNSVIFEDGTQVDADAIIFCTGYEISFPFLNKNLFNVSKNGLELYKLAFSSKLPWTIAFVGFCQPSGAIMPLSEMQSRWITRFWSCKCGLPSDENIKKDIQRKIDFLAKQFVSRTRHTIQVTFPIYIKELAELVGCNPQIIEHLDIAKYILFSAVYPCHFRLDGPSAWPGAKQEIIKTYNSTMFERPENECSFDTE